MMKPARDSVFLKACRKEKTPYTPVWIMRQAGRYMASYRQLRRRFSFESLCRKPGLAAQITVEACQKIGADAAILFSDILLLLQPLGFRVRYPDQGGPVLEGTGSLKIKRRDFRDALNFVYEAAVQSRRMLDSRIALIGFAGAPFTLASYLIEGGKSRSFIRTREWMHSEESEWHSLMESLASAVIEHLKAQAEAGCDCLQIFDTWIGCLTPREYRRYVFPHSRQVLSALRGLKIPLIHFGKGTKSFLKAFAQAGGDIVGIDSSQNLGRAWKEIGYRRGIQGNLDPQVLLQSQKKIRSKVIETLRAAQGRPGHIFNLGHGVLPETPEANVRYLIDCVHELSQTGDLNEV